MGEGEELQPYLYHGDMALFASARRRRGGVRNFSHEKATSGATRELNSEDGKKRRTLATDGGGLHGLARKDLKKQLSGF
jgi:hypothetical protein